jgi:hypothetical protein
VLADIQALNLCSSVTCSGIILHIPNKSPAFSDNFMHGPMTDLQAMCHFMNSHPSVIQNYSTLSGVCVWSPLPLCITYLCYSSWTCQSSHILSHGCSHTVLKPLMDFGPWYNVSPKKCNTVHYSYSVCRVVYWQYWHTCHVMVQSWNHNIFIMYVYTYMLSSSTANKINM